MTTYCLLVFALFTVAAATQVNQCPGKSFNNLADNVQLIPCKKTPCRLRKGTNQHITISFTPEKDMTDIRNHVTADVFGVALPFVGVDGQSICKKLETESGDKAECPIKAGTKYIYKDSFPVLSFYPSIDLKVHWSLQNSDADIICFEIPAKIAK